jgi:predicted RNA-binding protein with PUA-like domain
MKKGEKLVIYHSNVGKAAVGTAKVVSVDATDPRQPHRPHQAGEALKREKPLAEMREAEFFRARCCFASSGFRLCR